jgi:hypothetical protein
MENGNWQMEKWKMFYLAVSFHLTYFSRSRACDTIRSGGGKLLWGSSPSYDD